MRLFSQFTLEVLGPWTLSLRGQLKDAYIYLPEVILMQLGALMYCFLMAIIVTKISQLATRKSGRGMKFDFIVGNLDYGLSVIGGVLTGLVLILGFSG